MKNCADKDDARRYSRDKRFLGLFMANERRIYNFILSLVGNYSDADDLIQETAVVMFSKFDEFEAGNFAAWGMRIARYKILSYRKRQVRKPFLFSNDAFARIIAESEKVAERDDDRVRALQNCLLKLSENDRRLISMRYEHDTTTKKVAERTGRSVEGLYQTMARIHKMLLECIRRTLSAWEMPS